MSIDLTQAQGGEEIQRSLKLSQQRVRPPSDVPGYEPRKFLGSGAYGEVWVAIDRTTGRQVAIKFYLHRGGLDWSLLSHEVEKLAFLSADRYVVQLLDVGWDAEPPYYVMEYVEHGSLDDRLTREGRLNAAEATALFREIAVGLMHSHGKGVLHCDLKPANILLDQDGKPRLADFGQSRLSHEQTPALGTLFYMAPEQADTAAVPDARWDVYSLGAIFYAMLTGHPPHRHTQSVSEIESAPHLEERLARYRQLIAKAPPPSEHRKVRGVDKQLAEIIDRCLVADPRQRFPTVQAVIDALDARETRRSRRPLMVLGAIGPVLLLSVMAWLAWLWFTTSLGHTEEALTESALQGLKFAAQSVANGANNELESRFNDVAGAARDPYIIESLLKLEEDPETHKLLAGLGNSEVAAKQFHVLLDQLGKSPEMKKLQDRLERFDQWMLDQNKKSESWFITDDQGIQVAHWYESTETLGHNYSWRSYYHGGANDQAREWRPAPGEHLERTQLSAAYRSDRTGQWVVAISSPIYQLDKDRKRQKFLGVVGVSFNVEKKFINVPEGSRQFAVLVDAREGTHAGLVLQHPYFNQLLKESSKVPERFENDAKYRVELAALDELKNGSVDYRDPIGNDDDAKGYATRYLAAEAPIEVTQWEGETARLAPTGWVIVVQEPYRAAIGGTLNQLRDTLLSSGVIALGIIGLVIMGLWWFVIRMLEKPVKLRSQPALQSPNMAETLPQPRSDA